MRVATPSRRSDDTLKTIEQGSNQAFVNAAQRDGKCLINGLVGMVRDFRYG